MRGITFSLLPHIPLSRYLPGVDVPFVVISVSIRKRCMGMARFGETVQVLVQMKEYNGIRMTLEYTVFDKETGAIRCVGESRHCFLTRDGKPVSLKRNYIEMDRAFREYSEQSQKEE